MIETIKDKWIKAAHVSEFPEDAGVAVLIDGKQIAVFNANNKTEWYATQNMCPHRQEMALSRGLVGDAGGEPKVACPFHKKSFSLKSGSCLSGEDYQLKTYPVKVMDDFVYIDSDNSND